MPELLKTAYKKQVFRAFNTKKVSEELLDDIGLTQAEQDVAKDFFYDQKTQQQNPIERIFDRSMGRAQIARDIHAKFTPENWSHTRFSDGSRGVLYTGEAVQTVLEEKKFYMQRFYFEESMKKTFNVDFAISKLRIQTQALIDLTNGKYFDVQQLQCPDQKSYAYCQDVARQCIDQGAQAIRSPSARHDQGVCVPIFRIEVVQKDYNIQTYVKAEIAHGKMELFYPKK
jgi:hypothetical protein